MKTEIKIILSILIIFCSCERGKNKGKEFVEKSKTEIADVSKKTWKKSVNFAFNKLSSTENTALEGIYPNENIPEMEKIKSIQINTPPNFYSCYFKYKSNKAEILEFLSDLKTERPDISDAKAIKTDGQEMIERLEFIDNELTEFKKEISFFEKINDIENLEFYRCNKYPNVNYIAVDIENGIIFHLIQNYWD